MRLQKSVARVESRITGQRFCGYCHRRRPVGDFPTAKKPGAIWCCNPCAQQRTQRAPVR